MVANARVCRGSDSDGSDLVESDLLCKKIVIEKLPFISSIQNVGKFSVFEM